MTLAKFLKWIIYTSLAIIPALAWYVSESTFFPYITGKNFSFRFLIEISFMAWILLAFIEPAFRPRRSIVFYSYSAFLFIIFIANVFGANPYFSFFGNFERMEGWFTHLHLFLYFTILYSVYKTEADWMRMFGWFSVGALAVAMQGVFQMFGQKTFFLSKFLGEGLIQFINTAYPTSMGNTLRLDSTLGNSAYYGIYTLFFVFISALLAHRMKKWKGPQTWGPFIGIIISSILVLARNFLILAANAMIESNNSIGSTLGFLATFLWLVGLVGIVYYGNILVKKLAAGEIGSYPFAFLGILNLILLAYTQTRGSYFGLIGGLGVVVFCFVLGYWKKARKTAITSLALLVVASVFFIGIFALRESAFIKNSVVLNRIATIRIANILFNPITSINMIRNESNDYLKLNEYFGEATIVSRLLNMKMSIDGWNDTPKSMLIGYGQENYSKVFAAKFDPRMYAQEAWFDRAHDVFMDWLVAGGILGLLSYLALYFTSVYMLWLGKGKFNIALPERAILTGLLTAYFIHNIFVFDNLISYIIFVSLLAYIASRTRDTDTHINNEFTKSHKEARMFSPKLIVLSTSGSFVFVFTMFLYTVFLPLQTNLDIIDGFKNMPTSYNDLATTTQKAYKSFTKAYNRNTFGSVEVMEQMIQQVMRLSQVDVSKLDPSVAKSYTDTSANFKSFAEQTFEQWIAEKPTARNTSFYSSYLRQSGQLEKALKYSKMAHDISPSKQIIAFEYIAALVGNNKLDEAIAISKVAYESEPTFETAKNVYESLVKEKASSTPAVSTKPVKK